MKEVIANLFVQVNHLSQVSQANLAFLENPVQNKCRNE